MWTQDINMTSPWSANGNRISYCSPTGTAEFNSYGGRIWFIVNTDGTLLRTANGSPSRVYFHTDMIHWSPVEVDTYYEFGRNGTGEGLSTRDLYRVSVTDDIVSRGLWITFPGSNELSLWKSMSADGTEVMAMESRSLYNKMYPATIYPSGSKGLDDTNGWAYPQIDTYWGDSPNDNVTYVHDMYVAGTSSTKLWLYFMPQTGAGGGSSWWRATFTGSAADGGPLHTQDHTSPYNWGGELEPVNVNSSNQPEGYCVAGSRDPWACDGDAGTDPLTYMSHFTPDRWGTKILGAYSPMDPCAGASIYDLTTHKYDIKCVDVKNFGGGHYSWAGWTDTIVTTPTGIKDLTSYGGHYAWDKLVSVKYNDASTLDNVASTHVRESGGTDYQTLPRVGQSPDGTKAAFHSDFLTGTANALDVFWAVVYYPYPPQITGATKSGDNIQITWDFRHATGTPRTYTKRGWPNELTNYPPAPREIKSFRLWVSANNANWTPVSGTISYNNVGGAWTATLWSKTYTQAVGTSRWYAVTSLEHSGLESHALSNSWKVTLDGSGNIIENVQGTAYPSSPGGNTNFYANLPVAPRGIASKHCGAVSCSNKIPTPIANGQYLVSWAEPGDTSLIRHYNVYAKDGAAVSVAQTNRVASIPRGYCSGGTCSWVDWLGNTSGITQYAVTSVDYLGNESVAGSLGAVPIPPKNLLITSELIH
jgi:hypothetical protein